MFDMFRLFYSKHCDFKIPFDSSSSFEFYREFKSHCKVRMNIYKKPNTTSCSEVALSVISSSTALLIGDTIVLIKRGGALMFVYKIVRELKLTIT